jgi:hypothetical protein
MAQRFVTIEGKPVLSRWQVGILTLKFAYHEMLSALLESRERGRLEAEAHDGHILADFSHKTSERGLRYLEVEGILEPSNFTERTG